MDSCTLRAYAKINLGLDVVGRLPNGYHEVRMVMQTVDISDVLTFARAESGIALTADAGELPLNEDNLIWRAARLMQTECGAGGVRVRLEKHIPIAAGMAGGSTDAAAALRGMRQLYGLDMTDERLRELGVRIGADVPYCVMGGTALAEGIGEKLTQLPAPPEAVLIVAKPDINVSTKYVYEHLDAQADVPHPDIDGMLAALRAQDLGGITERLGNVLESVTETNYPVIGSLKRVMLEHGAAGSLMSGSGPTVFGIFADENAARGAADAIRGAALAKQVFVTTWGHYAG